MRCKRATEQGAKWPDSLGFPISVPLRRLVAGHARVAFYGVRWACQFASKINSICPAMDRAKVGGDETKAIRLGSFLSARGAGHRRAGRACAPQRADRERPDQYRAQPSLRASSRKKAVRSRRRSPPMSACSPMIRTTPKRKAGWSALASAFFRPSPKSSPSSAPAGIRTRIKCRPDGKATPICSAAFRSATSGRCGTRAGAPPASSSAMSTRTAATSITVTASGAVRPGLCRRTDLHDASGDRRHGFLFRSSSLL